MGWDWGPWVNLCRWVDRTGEFCRFCVVVNRAWHNMMGRNPTFIGWQPPREEHTPEDANYI